MLHCVRACGAILILERYLFIIRDDEQLFERRDRGGDPLQPAARPLAWLRSPVSCSLSGMGVPVDRPLGYRGVHRGRLHRASRRGPGPGPQLSLLSLVRPGQVLHDVQPGNWTTLYLAPFESVTFSY